MTSWILDYLFGKLHMDIEGDRIEELINLSVQHRIHITNIERVEARKVSFSLPLSEFRLIYPLLRRTNSRMRIKRKKGLPFTVNKLMKRYLFAAGLVIFVLLIYLASAVVWKVDVKGNERIPSQMIIEAASKAGIKPGAFKYKLKNTGDLQKKMMNQVDAALLLLVDIDGTRATITVVEKVRPDKPVVKGPQHIISSTEATIISVLAEKGLPVVKEGQLVKKGDVLISGKVGNEEHFAYVESKGSVKGLVWMEANVVVPLTVEKKTLTGDFVKKYYVQIGNKKIGLKKKPPFEMVEVTSNVSPLKIWKWTLPIAWITEKTMEADITTVERSVEEARLTGLKYARSAIRQQIGEEAEMTAEKVLHQNVDNGKVYMKIQFDVIQEIGLEKPITIPQGEDAIDN